MSQNQNTSGAPGGDAPEAVRKIPDFARFVAIDLETTGLDPAEGEIIELGAVRFIDGKESDAFRSLVKPQAGFPERNRRLTGIDPADLREARSPKDALEEFKAFLRDDLLVSHNAPFDLSFLATHLGKHGIDPIKNPALCTLHLAAFMNPEAETLQLGTLAKNLGVTVIDPHRAMQDARMAGRVFLRLKDELALWPAEFLGHLAGYRGKSLDPHFDLLDSLAGQGSPDGGAWRLSDAVLGHLADPPAPSALPPLRVLAETGERGRADDPALAAEVAQAFGRGGLTLLEDARPGAPPVSSSVPPNTPDIPRFVVGIPDESALPTLLGADDGADGADGPDGRFYLGLRSEYICLRRAFAPDGRPAGWLELSPYERIVLARWLAGTRTGRFARVNWWLLNNYSGLKGHLNALSGNEVECVGPDAPHDGPCFAEMAREIARSSAGVIVQQRHLCARLLGSISSERLLDPFDACVIEGASRLVHSARATESRVLELDSIKRRLTQLSEFAEGGDTGFADAVNSALSSVKDLLDACRVTIGAFRDARSRDNLGPITVDEESWTTDIFSELSGTLEVAHESLLRASERIGGIPALTEDAAAVGAMLSRIAETLRMFREAQTVWALSLEGAPARNPKRITLRLEPVDVSDVIRRITSEAKLGVIASDRQLRYADSFDHLRSMWGLQADVAVTERVLTDPSHIPPPLFLPEDINAPAARSGRRYHWEKYMERTANLLRMVADALGGRTVAAFSAHHELRRVRELLEQNPPREAIVLAQYMDGTKSALIREYLANPATLLLGGRSFLDGVDLRPAGFTALILVKLPFVSPEEPLHRAALRLQEAQGLDGMTSYLVPLAAETSNRWIDSLISGPITSPANADSDMSAAEPAGAVILLDPRASQNEWGDELVSSLNARPAYRLSFREMLARLGEMVRG